VPPVRCSAHKAAGPWQPHTRFIRSMTASQKHAAGSAGWPLARHAACGEGSAYLARSAQLVWEVWRRRPLPPAPCSLAGQPPRPQPGTAWLQCQCLSRCLDHLRQAAHGRRWMQLTGSASLPRHDRSHDGSRDRSHDGSRDRSHDRSHDRGHTPSIITRYSENLTSPCKGKAPKTLHTADTQPV